MRERLTPGDVVVIVVGTASEILDKVIAAIPGLTEHKVLPFDAD